MTVIVHRPKEVPVYNIGDYIVLKAQPGVVYQVVEVRIDERYASLNDYKLAPVFGAFGAADNKGYREERHDDMKRLTCAEVGIEHLKMQEFVRSVFKRSGETGDGIG